MADGSADAILEKCGRVSLKGRPGLIWKLPLNHCRRLRADRPLPTVAFGDTDVRYALLT